MTATERIMFIVDLWVFFLVCWHGYVERRNLFTTVMDAFRNGNYTIRRAWHDDYEFVATGRVEGREFFFRTNVSEYTGAKTVEFTVIDPYGSVRAAPWGYGSGCMNERDDLPLLAELIRTMRFRGGLGIAPA
jgi:hypothetical protein